jgi:hypothetical protein
MAINTMEARDLNLDDKGQGKTSAGFVAGKAETVVF